MRPTPDNSPSIATDSQVKETAALRRRTVRTVGSTEASRNRKAGLVRTATRVPRLVPIAAPLLVVTASLDEQGVAEQLVGRVTEVTVLGVFGHTDRTAEPVVDLRESDGGAPPASLSTVSLGRAPGERTRTAEIAVLIGDALERSGASTVAIGLGLLGGDHLEASDAALLARRKAKPRIGWIVYLDADADAVRIARRRMQLFVRGIRLEPIAVADDAPGSTTRYWEIRASS
jgi:hypothetical protein